MSKNSTNNTYTRIINASLKLFNEQGERTISTNHIAQFLDISPGNLYYHFANKDEIIVQLFQRYTDALYDFLSHATLPEDIEQSIQYMRGIYDIMWEYRFLFRDVNALLGRSGVLSSQHNTFTRERIAPLLVKLLEQLRDQGLISIDPIGIHDLSINMWLITKYWFDFDSSLPNDFTTPDTAKARGIYRTLSLLRPYFSAQSCAIFDEKVATLRHDCHLQAA